MSSTQIWRRSSKPDYEQRAAYAYAARSIKSAPLSLCSLDDGRRTVDESLQSNAALNEGDLRYHGEPIEKLAAMVTVVDDAAQQVVRTARHQEAAHHFGEQNDLRLEGVKRISGLLFQRDGGAVRSEPGEAWARSAAFSSAKSISVHFALPFLSRIDPQSGRPIKRKFGPWVFLSCGY